MLDLPELKTAFVDLLGEPNTEWKTFDLITQWVKKTSRAFAEGYLVLADMIIDGTVRLKGNLAELANTGEL